MLQILELRKVAYHVVNPYAVDVLRTKRKDLLYGILRTEELLDLLASEGLISTTKKSIILSIRTRVGRNSRILELLEATGERACRRFFHPCLMLVEPELYDQMKGYVVSLNEPVRDARRQLIGYLLERDRDIGREVAKKAKVLEIVAQVKPFNPKTTHQRAGNLSMVNDADHLETKPQPCQSMELLIQQGLDHEDLKTSDDADVRVGDKSRVDTSLHKAVREDDWQLVERLRQNGADVNARDDRNKTALWDAVANRHEKTTAALVQAGTTMDGEIMSEAIQHNQESVLRILPENPRGAVSEEDVNSAIFSAVRQNKDGALLALIDSGADVNTPGEQGYTPLLLSAEIGHTEVFRVLMEHHANLEATLPDRSSALHLAVQGGSLSIVEKLLEKGCDPNSTGLKAHTPLHVAAVLNRPDIVSALLNAGAQVNASAQDGVTPLHLASHHGNEDTVVQLIEGKAKLEAVDKLGRTALHWAAAAPGEGNVADVLLSSKINANALDSEKRSALHLAATEGNVHVVTSLLSHKANAGVKDKNGSTPLHCAAAGGHGGVVSALLQSLRKKGLEERNTWKKTALHVAAEKGHDGVVALLLEAGAKVNTTDQNKDTPLHCAARGGHREAAKTLVGWGQGSHDTLWVKKANLQATNSVGKTPLQVAESGETAEHESTAILLRRKMLLVK